MTDKLLRRTLKNKPYGFFQYSAAMTRHASIEIFWKAILRAARYTIEKNTVLKHRP